MGAGAQAPVAGRVFAPGPELSEQDLCGLAPDNLPWGHRSAATLPDALVLVAGNGGREVESFLSALGYRRILRTEAADALAAMRRELPGLVLLLPGTEGPCTLAILQEMLQDAVLRHVPVLAIGQGTDPVARHQALAFGAADVLSLPVDRTEFGLRIRNVLAANAYREYLAQHDALTGLPNKARYRKAAAEVLADATAHGHEGALLHVGVDGLGRVNDALGRIVGDQLLQRIAKRLASCVQTEAEGELASGRHQPTLYRLDGDEFAIVVPCMEGMHSIAAFISKLLDDAVASCHPRGAPELFATCSIGVSVFPRDGLDPDLLVRNAGLALRRAKQAGSRRCEFFIAQFAELARGRLDLGAELRHAIRRDQIELLYEPVFELLTGRVAGAQTVVRWRHASGRVIEGDELMDLAAGSEMGVTLTEWVVEQVRSHMRNWRLAGLQPVPTGVKASLADLHAPDLVHLVQAATAAGIEPRMITLQLQHVAALRELLPKDAAGLPALRKRGVRIALDRFGAGGSVADLRQLECDEVRVDASFLQDVERAPARQAMLLGMHDLARRLGLGCVACGIDTAQKLDFLRKHGWDRGQGALFGEALDGLTFAARWLTRSGKPQRVLPSEPAVNP